MNIIKTGLFVSALLFGSPLLAGVEMDLVTKDAAGAVTGQMKLYAQSGNIRMENVGGSSGEDMSMIFLGSEFIILDHANQKYVVMDEAMVAEVGTQVDAAMQQMQAQLASMPPEQRAMVEQMMQGQMAAMMGTDDDTPAPSVEETGSGQWQGAACTQYSVYEGGEKTQEVCAAPLAAVEGADEAMQAFESMAIFITSLADSMPGSLGAAMAENPMGLVDQFDGFPVRTVDFSGGEVLSETTLESVIEKNLDPALFVAPDGYTRRDPFSGQ